MRDDLNIIYFGSTGILSVGPLEYLIERGFNVCAVIIPASSLPPETKIIRKADPIHRSFYDDIPLLNPAVHQTVAPVAQTADIPVWEVGSLTSPGVVDILKSYRPDAFCVSCFPRRLPESIRQIPTYGCFNLHPSLLPAYRGPAPIFWVFHQGEQKTGVTVHLMNQQFDAGDIVAQEAIGLGDGITSEDLALQCARMGSRLLAETLCAIPLEVSKIKPQSEAHSSYYSFPVASDYMITPERSARWAFNFIRGIGSTGCPIDFHVGKDRFRVKEAIDWTTQTEFKKPYQRRQDMLWIKCNPGVLQVRI